MGTCQVGSLWETLLKLLFSWVLALAARCDLVITDLLPLLRLGFEYHRDAVSIDCDKRMSSPPGVRQSERSGSSLLSLALLLFGVANQLLSLTANIQLIRVLCVEMEIFRIDNELNGTIDRPSWTHFNYSHSELSR